MDFNLSEQEKMLQAAARNFAAKSVKARAAEIDASAQFPEEIVREMGEHGYRGMPFPAGCGGSGAGYVSYVLALEQVCQASLTVGAIMAINTVPEEAIFRFGDEEQKRAFLIPLARGKRLGGIAFTEAETGSDPGAITTTAYKTAGGYVITGHKQFVAQAAKVNLSLVFARSGDKVLDAFIVDTATPGYTVHETPDTLGLRGLGTGEVTLDEVFVPERNRLGKTGQGFEILLEAISLGRLGVAVEGVAVAQAALDLALHYARQRKTRGKPINHLAGIQWLLAEMASRIEAARWLTYRTAFLRDQGQSIRYESSLAKLFASQAAVEVTRMAMQVHGSYGTMKSLAIERLYRDAKMLEIYVGVSEIQRSIIAEHLV